MDPVEVISTMWKDGYGVSQIAQAIGRGNKFVINRLFALGFDRQRLRTQYGRAQCVMCASNFVKRSTRHELCPTCIPDRTAQVFWHRYGLTHPQRVAMYESQNGLCKLCDAPISFEFDKAKNFSVVDHDHTTNKIRGLLCAKCNWTLGVVENMSDEWRKRAEEYLNGSH